MIAPRVVAALLSVLVLAGCATPAVQPVLTPPVGFTGPAVEVDALLMDDGARLPLARWIPTQAEPWAVIVALHGVNDSRASFRMAGPWWAERGIETWAIDQRGFGAAPGRGVWAGEARMTEDLRTAVALARARHPNALIAVAGESMGGAVTVSAFASDRPPAADRVILLSPGVWGWTAQGPLNAASLWVGAHTVGPLGVSTPDWYLRLNPASDNALELRRNDLDPNSIVAPRIDALYGLISLMESASLKLGQVRAPTLMIYGATDHVIPKDAVRQALRRAGDRPGFRTAYYPGGGHILNRDLQGERLYRDIEAWLRDAGAPLPSGAQPVLTALEE